MQAVFWFLGVSNAFSFLAFITALVFVVLCLMGWYYASNFGLKKEHAQVVFSLKAKFTLHQQQIAKRKAGLDTYDLLKYNLKEALVVQNNISLKPPN